jgi:hypothetical protein
MKLPEDTRIAPEKLTQYLLVARRHNDKSKWLSRAGYMLENWQILQNDLRRQILLCEATPTDRSEYGQMYEIRGRLVGPNHRELHVVTVWMTEFATGVTKFITMYPDKRM